MAGHRLLAFESKREPLLGGKQFAARVIRNLGASALLIGLSLLAGMAGYSYFEGMAGIDAFVNASMILSGMGPLDQPKTWGGKLFAGLYALYSGLALIVVAGILLAPFVHRLLHRFHLEGGKGGDQRGEALGARRAGSESDGCFDHSAAYAFGSLRCVNR